MSGMGEGTLADAIKRVADRIPAAARAEAERLGPPDWDSSTESPEQAAERKATQAANRANRWRSRLPYRYANAGLDDLAHDPEQADTARAIMGWLRHRDALTLVLAGPVGTGKTHAAYAIGNAAVGRGRWVEAWRLHDLLADLRPDGDPRAWDRACGCDLLIVDDLGATKVSEWADETVTALLDSRLNAGRRTVLTTNQNGAALAAVWNGRFIDRLNDSALALVMRGESRRKVLDW